MLKIAVWQAESVIGDAPGGAARLVSAAERAAQKGAGLLLAPELVISGYGAGEALASLAEPADGRMAEVVAQAASRLGLAIAYGYAEREGEAVYNAARFVSPEGFSTNYRKCHLYGDYERGHFTPADSSPAVFEWQGLKLGMLICYDVEFPECVRALALAGAELALVPTALPATSASRYIARNVVPVRAFENQMFIAYADLAGSDGTFSYGGLSCVAAPDGSDLARAGEAGEALVLAEIDPAAYGAARAENPYLADLRRDLFRE